MKSRKTVRGTIFFVLAIVVLINILASKFFFRLDFTEDKRYTLSEATKDILGELTEPVTVRAYFSNNLPPMLDNIRRDFRDMLVEYTQASDGMLVYEFVDPLKDEDGEVRAQQDGIMQMQVQVREKDQMKTQIAYMGAMIELGEEKEVIPVIQTTSGLEYNITSNIKKLAVMDKPIIGLLSGHGERGFAQLAQAIYELQVLYQVEEITLTDTTKELERINTLAIIGPVDSLPQGHLNQISAFVERGGNVLMALNRVEADLNSGYNMGQAVNTGLEGWLSDIGINLNSNFVLDANAVTVTVTQQQGPFSVQRPMAFPYIPKINNFTDHPITSGLEQVMMTFVSSIDFRGDSALQFIPLVKTSELATTRPATTYIDLAYQWSQKDFRLSELTLAAAIEGPIKGSEAKMVVIGDADFPGSDNPQQQINPDNVSLLVNAVDWLTDDTGLIELRTQGATARPIDEIEDGKKTFLKYFNFLLPILLAIGYGIFRAQRNRIQQLKRKEAGYVQ